MEALLHEHEHLDGLLDSTPENIYDSLGSSGRGAEHALPFADRQFGDYELQGEIARGAMGVVYRAYQKSLKRIVAVKMIRSAMLANDDDVARFRSEAEAAGSLDYTNIVLICEVGEFQGQHYFSMKLIEGETLRENLAELLQNPRAAARLMAIVARAIHAAHQRGILHRDLKPRNILVDENGEPHVTDFGLAKQIDSASSATLSGQIIGTPSYMAPEQANGGGKNVTTAADVYGLGAIFYELLTGVPPHKGETLMETLKLLFETEPKLPSSHHPKVDRDLETIAMKCLEKDRAQRYLSARELADELERWLRGEPIEARPAGSIERSFKWMKRKPIHAIAAMLGILLLLTLGIGGPLVALQQNRLTDEAVEAQTPLGSPGEDFPAATKDGAWVTINSPRALYYEGKHQKTYSGWVTRQGAIVVWSFDHRTKKTETFTLHQDFQADTHDNPAFYARKDGRLQVFYTKLNTEKFVRSFVTTHPEDISQWEPVNNITTNASATYTLVFRLSAEQDRVYLFTRTLNYHPCALTSEDDGDTWSEPVQLIDVGRGRPYQRMGSDGISRIHVAFTTGHPRKEATNSVYYFYYENGACYKADGTFIKPWKDLPILPTEADFVYGGSTKGRAWTWDLAIGTDGNPVIAHGVYPEETDHKYYYARWNGAKWSSKEMTKARRWFPETPEGAKEREPHYSPGYSVDHHDPSIVYLSKHMDEEAGQIEVQRWQTQDGGDSWSSRSITSGSKGLNVNPVGNWDFPYGSKPGQKMILWMNGRYRHYTDYATGIRYWIEEDSD